MGNISWGYLGEGKFALSWSSRAVFSAYAMASHADGRNIDTREARLLREERLGNTLVLTFEAENGLILTEHLELSEAGIPLAYAALSEKSGAKVESRRLVPLAMQEAPEAPLGLWKSLWTKMLLVPYDNTMWLRYEAQPLRAGRKSYDLTVLFDEESREGLLVGAIDFTVWKNALVCSATDAKSILAQSGVAGEGTHDSQIHGSMEGDVVTSSRFCILYGDDYRMLLEKYGGLVAEETQPLAWREGVPFGFNSWAGLAFRLNGSRYRETGKFLREELRPLGYENQGISYVNLDAGWNVIPEADLLELVEEIHKNGQKAGIYDAPFAFFGKDIKEEVPGVPGHVFEEILLKDAFGRLLPRVDGAIPFDVTHPVWRQHTAWKLERFVRWNFDYVKVDFMSHGGMEGCHSDTAVRTGRQAIALGYQFLEGCLQEEKIGRPFFISLSIAPLFPNGYGHARRFSCDAFGTSEDVEYVLNAQTYAWWQNGRLYAFNDPDHICLLKSFGMEKDSSLGEARARYTASAIAGTVMMLSDDYERPEARERSRKLASNKEINHIAASRVAFRPVEAGGASASHVFTAKIEGKQYIALFHWAPREEILRVDPARAGLRAGVRYQELWSGGTWEEEEGALCWKVKGCDALVLKEIE